MFDVNVVNITGGEIVSKAGGAKVLIDEIENRSIGHSWRYALSASILVRSCDSGLLPILYILYFACQGFA